MKGYILFGQGLDLVDGRTECIGIFCETPEQVEEQIGFIRDEARQWASAGWRFPLDYSESESRHRGHLTGYSMSVEYDVRDPKQKEEWLENPALASAGISPDDFNYTENSRQQYERDGIKTVSLVWVRVREITIKQQ